ncbi:MAG: phosphodiester glycosidase family protein [Phycisphaerales bacterium]|nr:phosphodiester glycosidase family protein [Phycisphaerales bacterium]
MKQHGPTNAALHRSPSSRAWAVLGAALLATVAAYSDTQTAIAPGVVYRELLAPGPNRVFVLAVERTRGEYGFQVGWPEARRNYTRRATTSQIADRYNHPPQQRVIAAINASFFGPVPETIGAAATGGELHDMPDGAFDTLVITTDGRAAILESLGHRWGWICGPGSEPLTLHHYNTPHIAGTITAYTPIWGPVMTPPPTRDLAVVHMAGVSYPMRGRSEVVGTIEQTRLGIQTAIDDPLLVPPGGLVLVGSGSAGERLAQAAVPGTQLRLYFDATHELMQAAEVAVTGMGWLVHDGVPHEPNWKQYGFWNKRHPRTVFAWNDMHWFFIVIDGRSPISVGMTFPEMAELLTQTLGALEALNLDGGGSSTLVVDGQVRNVPSDGRERPVANALLLTCRSGP